MHKIIHVENLVRVLSYQTTFPINNSISQIPKILDLDNIKKYDYNFNYRAFLSRKKIRHCKLSSIILLICISVDGIQSYFILVNSI